MTLSSDISTTSTALSDIKTAIIAKGVTPSGNITTYATAIGNISGGGSPVITSLSVTPTTSAQTITSPEGVDGYSPVNVSAVTSSIDANIVAENIKDGVSILGVTGTLEGGMDTVEAYNNTGSAISTGDKVWINKGDVYSYDFNVIGSPTINKDTNIASGFNADSFLTKTGFSSANPWEIDLKIMFTNVSTGQNYLSMSDNGFSVASGQWQFYLSSTSANFDIANGVKVGSISTNTWYWIRFVYSGTDYKFYVSTDGETYSLLQTFNTSAQMKTNGTLWFGNYVGSTLSPAPYASIDLSETYMDINNQRWWTAVTKVWDNDYKLDSFFAQNTPNVTKQGSVTLTDNYIGSGFSSSNYLKSNRTISEIGTADSWEFVTRVCMTSSQSSNGMVVNQSSGDYTTAGINIIISPSSYPRFTATAQDLSSLADISGSSALQNNQWYWLKGEFTGTAYNFYISTDKETWTNLGTAASTTKVYTPTSPWRFGSSVVDSGFYLYGKIDFKETYLKINGEVAWNAIGYGMSGNITEDTLTGTATENIAIGGTGDVEIGNVIEPTLGTKTITANGTYNASTDNLEGYSAVTVDVLGIPREVSQQGVYQTPTESFTFSLPSNATDISPYALYYAFYQSTGLASASFPALTTISGSNAMQYAFRGCTSLASVSFPNLTTISGSSAMQFAFYGCTSLASVSFPNLTTISAMSSMINAFYGCTSLASVSFPNLTTISGQSAFGNSYAGAFQNCTNIESISFPSLTTSSFGTYKDQFGGMLLSTGTTKTHTLHFPSNMQSTISGLNGYPNFGGTSGYVTLAFDLPATS